MKLSIIGAKAVTLSEVFGSIGIETDQGRFNVAQRDSGIEVVLNGQFVWSSTTLPNPAVRCAELKDAIRDAMNNLGVPGPGCPASVAEAHRILSKSIAPPVPEG